MRKKKKGSSFVIVLIITSIFFIVGTSVLTMVGSDYKNRINESKKLQNLYEADSGLDIVYNLIMKNSDAAIIEANSIVEKMDNSQESYKKDKFKTEFMNFLGTTNITAKKVSSDALNVTTSDAILAQSIDIFKYRQKNSSGNWEWSSPFKPEATVELLSYDYNTTDKSITIGVRSTFVSIGESKNQKTITTSFTVKAPEYTDSNINIYPVYDKKIITADGDLSIDGDTTAGGNTNIIGDVWVNGTGNTNAISAEAFNKYNGGISLKNTGMTLLGNMYTNRTLSLGNNAQSTITGNVYGLNTYLGPQTGTLANNNLTITEDLITNNDLTLNSTNGRASMKNFYGINETTSTTISDPAKAAKESSSIIINETSGNNLLAVTNNAYIMGVAYLDTDTKYQTGESIAVKGNYLAYTDVLPSYANRVTLRYYNPLQLIDKIYGLDANSKVVVDNEDTTLAEKKQYFNDYYSTTDNVKNMGNVRIGGQVCATGAYVNANTPTGNQTPLTAEQISNDVSAKRGEFASNVLSMGDITGGAITNISDLYAYGNVQKTVSNQINFAAIPSIDTTNTSAKIIKSAGDVTVSGNTISYNGNNENFDSATNLLIFTQGNVIIEGTTNMHALIIANGDVNISGRLDFTGNIITDGKVAITGSDVKNLTYDADFTRGVIASNYKIFSNLFIGSPKNETVNMGTNMYNVEDCITKGTWRIVK